MKNFYVCTYAKVGTTSIYHGIIRNYQRRGEPYSIKFTHDLTVFEKEELKDTLIISGVRNPIERNISYFFEICLMKQPTQVKNKYKQDGDIGIVGNPHELLNMDIQLLIDKFYKSNIHNTEEWLAHFFEILNINEPFNKEDGYKIYELTNNNKLLLFKFEELDKNKKILEKLLNIKIINENNSSQKWYKKKIAEFKNNIILNEEYLQILNTPFVKYFYTDDEINKMYNKYKR